MNTADLYAQINDPEWSKSYKAMRINSSAPMSGSFVSDQSSESDAINAELFKSYTGSPAMVTSREQRISPNTGAAVLMPIINQAMQNEYKTPEAMRADFIKRETDRKLKEEALKQLSTPQIKVY